MGVAPSLIRFWEKSFGITPHKNSQGRRKYTEKDIMVISHIYQLVKEKGYSLAGARRVLENKHTTASSMTSSQIVHRLLGLRAFLTTLKQAIKPSK